MKLAPGVYVTVWSGLTTVEPVAGSVVTVTARGSPSGSESLARTGMVTGTPSLVAAESPCTTGGRSIGVTSCPVLFEALASAVGEDTVAWLVTWGTAPAPTATVRGKLVEAPLAKGSGLVQVTACPLAEHVHPLPPPEANVSPAGNVSVTVSGPAASLAPRFDTAIV